MHPLFPAADATASHTQTTTPTTPTRPTPRAFLPHCSYRMLDEGSTVSDEETTRLLAEANERIEAGYDASAEASAEEEEEPEVSSSEEENENAEELWLPCKQLARELEARMQSIDEKLETFKANRKRHIDDLAALKHLVENVTAKSHVDDSDEQVSDGGDDCSEENDDPVEDSELENDSSFEQVSAAQHSSFEEVSEAEDSSFEEFSPDPDSPTQHATADEDNPFELSPEEWKHARFKGMWSDYHAAWTKASIEYHLLWDEVLPSELRWALLETGDQLELHCWAPTPYAELLEKLEYDWLHVIGHIDERDRTPFVPVSVVEYRKTMGQPSLFQAGEQ